MAQDTVDLITAEQARALAIIGLIENINAMDKCIVNGERVVQFRDERVEYQSLKELLVAANALRSRLAEILAAQQGVPSLFSGRTLLAYQDGKGL
jgi:hypothetical protein